MMLIMFLQKEAEAYLAKVGYTVDCKISLLNFFVAVVANHDQFGMRTCVWCWFFIVLKFCRRRK